MHNDNIHFEMLHILQLSVDKNGLCFNNKLYASRKFRPLIEKKTPF